MVWYRATLLRPPRALPVPGVGLGARVVCVFLFTGFQNVPTMTANVIQPLHHGTGTGFCSLLWGRFRFLARFRP